MGYLSGKAAIIYINGIYINILAYILWEHVALLQSTILSKYLRRLMLSHPAGQPACSCPDQWERAGRSTALPLKQSFFFICWPFSWTFLDPVMCSQFLHSSQIQKMFCFWFFPHSESISRLLKWRFPLPPTPARLSLWRGLTTSSWVLLCHYWA